MAHSCKRVQNGHQVCADHMLTRDGLRYRFRKQMEDVMSIEELTELHEMMLHTMLPSDKQVALDDRPQWYIEKVTKGEVPS